MNSAAAAFDLTDRIAIVTGAASGFGARIAGVLAAAGASIICVDLNSDGAAAVAGQLTERGYKARSAYCDVASADSITALGHELANENIDILVNNAGIVSPAKRLHEMSEAEWDRVLGVNLKGTYLCSRAFLPGMIGRGGCIINLASVLGMRGFYPNFPVVSANYFASKAGIVGLTKQIAAEYARDGVRANVICPAFHEGTDLGKEWRPLRSADQAVGMVQAIHARTPLGRMGKPEEMDALVLYLASDASSYVTGQVFAHDGGWSAT